MGPEKTTIPECEIDPRVGGRVYIVMEAGEGMGKSQGTRWPMDVAFSRIEENARLSYDARSWTDGEEATSTIDHLNDVLLAAGTGATKVNLSISITEIGPCARMAAFGMKSGFNQYLAKLDQFRVRHP